MKNKIKKAIAATSILVALGGLFVFSKPAIIDPPIGMNKTTTVAIIDPPIGSSSVFTPFIIDPPIG